MVAACGYAWGCWRKIDCLSVQVKFRQTFQNAVALQRYVSKVSHVPRSENPP